MLQTLAALDNCQDCVSLSDAQHLAVQGASGIEVDVAGVGVLLQGVTRTVGPRHEFEIKGGFELVNKVEAAPRRVRARATR